MVVDVIVIGNEPRERRRAMAACGGPEIRASNTDLSKQCDQVCVTSSTCFGMFDQSCQINCRSDYANCRAELMKAFVGCYTQQPSCTKVAWILIGGATHVPGLHPAPRGC